MSDSQCEETLFSDFLNQWKSVHEILTKSPTSSTISTNTDLVHNINDNLEEIKKFISSVTKWKKEVIDVFSKELKPRVSRLIKDLDHNGGVVVNGSAGNLRYIAQKVNAIKKGTQNNIPKLPKVDHIKSESNRRSNVWKKLMSEEEIMASPGMAMAKSTYDGLEPRVKLCFLCLSIFPENSVIRKRSLIYWWIGEGFMDGEKAEEEAEECFKKLCDSGLVEGVQKKYSRKPRNCRLNPWIRWMAIQIAKKTMFFHFDSDGKPTPCPSHCTRLASVAATPTRGGEEAEVRAEKVNLEPNASKLRSLFNIDVNCIECDKEEFKKLKELRTLQLGRWSTAPDHHIELVNPDFLHHLELLKNLRYLGLQGISRITELAGIRRLSELRVLDLRACHNLEKLPVEIASLKKLTHLDVSECYLLEYMPKGLGDLSELQLLNGFVVNTWNLQEACKLNELTKLVNLQKLSIVVGTEAMEEDGVLDPIGDITGLEALRITWGSINGTRKTLTWWSMVTISKAVMKFKKKVVSRVTSSLRNSSKQSPPMSKITLFLPPSLTKLDLQCYPEEEPPRFDRKPDKKKVKSLEKLYFRGGSLKSLSGIQKEEVSEVKYIRLRFLRYFEMEENDLRTNFRSLEILRSYECLHFKASLQEGSRRDLRNGEASTSTNCST